MIIFFFLIIALLLAAVFMYNSLIVKKNDVQRSFGSIDVLLRKRYDMIPNLVETVKEYMGYEKQVLTEVTELRSKAIAGTVSNEAGFSWKMNFPEAWEKLRLLLKTIPT